MKLRFAVAEARYVGARVALGVVMTVLAVVLDHALWESGPPAPFLLFYPAVVLAAWWGGWISGLTTTLLSMASLVWLFLPPTTSLAVSAGRDALDLAVFCGVSLLLTHFITRTRRALARAREALRVAEAANAAKEAVLAVVAHDLRNPLQTIGLGAELLARKAAVQDDASRMQLARIRRCAERARRLVDNIVDSARIGSSPLPLTAAEVPVGELIDEALYPFEPLADARAIRLELPAPEALEGSIVCDRDRIVQVLSNLVGNALQYTPRGGRIAVDVRWVDAGLSFTITDTGRGMTPDELDHAFERLWHGSGPGHGSGLGLWIASALVEAHGGKLEASSAPGSGTRMTFTLPPHPPARSEAAPMLGAPAHA